MHLRLALLCLFSLSLSINGQASSAYYGLPLGSIFYSNSATQGEVYVSETRKLIVVNFQHGGEAGCTTFMVGPAVPGLNASLSANKEGVILAIETKQQKRRKRQAWRSSEKAARTSSDPQPTGSGIVWDDQSKPAPAAPTPHRQSSSNERKGIRWGDSPAEAAQNPTSRSQSQSEVIRLGGGDASKRPQSKLRELPIEYIGGINIPDEEEGKNNPNVTALLNDPFAPDRPLIPVQRGPTEPPGPTTTSSATFQFGGKATAASSTTTTSESVKTFRGLPLPPAGPAAPSASAPGIAQDGSVVKLGEGILRNITEDQPEGNHTECGNGWCAVPDPRRRQPAPAQAATATPIAELITQQTSNDTRNFVVVEDRRAQFLPAEILQRQQQGPAELIAIKEPTQGSKKEAQPLPVIPRPAQESSSVRYSPPNLPQDGKTYALPRFNGENVIVLLPEPYELSEFQWFGIYDHCKRARTAFVNVRGIQAPKEAKLEGLRGWQYDVNSGDIYVKNCNTLLITNFTFNGAGKTEAFIYVGNGAFPHSIIQKARATVDGTFADRSLKNFNGEDVIVKLPNGWKTFDVTWLAVFNPKGNVSYGHVLVPPLVVPACEEPK